MSKIFKTSDDIVELIENQFGSKEEMDVAFDEAIKFLKNLNEIFE